MDAILTDVGVEIVRKSAFATIRVVRTSTEAESLLERLREAGLHPVDLSLSAPLPIAGAERSFPVQVPDEEAGAAEQLLSLAA